MTISSETTRPIDVVRMTVTLAVAVAASAPVACKSSPPADTSRSNETTERSAPPSDPDEFEDDSRPEKEGRDPADDASETGGSTPSSERTADEDATAAAPDCEGLGTDQTLELDFDGDDRLDTVSPAVSDDGKRLLEVRLADGTRYRLGAPDGPDITHRFYIQEKRSQFDGDFAGLCGWDIRANREGTITGGPPIPGADTYEITEARGDGLYVTGTDAAALLYLADDGWVYTSLGF